MFICLIRLLHLQAMFNYKMDLRCYFTCLHVLELLLFIAAIIIYGIYLSYILVLFGIRIFNLFKYVESMSLISLILQHLTISISNNSAYHISCYDIKGFADVDNHILLCSHLQFRSV
jgi:hypothetical protein